MTASKSKLVIGGLFAVMVLGVASTHISFRQRRLESAFETANSEGTADELRARLGNPWRNGACGETFGGTVPRGCKREILYASPLAPAIPEYWAFRYDQDGKLIDKYRYVSP